jgi:hypothetical protein
VNDKAKKLVPHFPRTGLRSLLRTASTGAVAAVIAVGVLFTAVASVPASQPSGKDGDLPMRLYGLIESVGVGKTETAPDGVTLTQIVAVLERAEKQAREQGPNFSPTIAQAAAELGMLYTTYQMQQLSFGPNNEGLRPEDAPAASGSGSGSEEDADDPASGPEKQAGSAERDGADTRDDADKKSGAKKDDDGERADGDTDGTSADDEEDAERPRPEEDTPPAVEVSNERPVIDPHDEDPETGHVTYDEVVIAAVRLANLLDPSVPNALVEVDGVEQGKGNRNGISLRESLLDVVSMFRGTTAGYLNGRIPANVLCPLEFAPGHMLRCDAAERLTALSAQFEAEFGYPIPITDSYRSYGAQVTLAGIKPHLAAIPGTSNHGWGIAVDLGNPIAGGNSTEYVWLRVHGPDYGWDNPSWARLGGAKPEPWHFEFFAAGSIPNRAIDPSDVGTWKSSDPEPPRYKPALDPKPKPKDGDSAGGVRKPATKPSDQPSDNPPSQKPSTPTPKPTPSDPADEPSRPTPPPPTTTPTPSPSPSPTPSDPSPDPSPSPSDPSPSPSPSEPTPSPEPSVDPDETTCPEDGTDGESSETETSETAETTETTEQEQSTTAETEPGSADESDPDPCPSGDPEEDAEPTATPSAIRPEDLDAVDDSED